MHKVWVRSLEILKQQEILNGIKEGRVVNFRSHKAQKMVKTMHFWGKNVWKKLRFMSLEAKKQQANNNWFCWRIQPTKQCMRNVF